MWSSLFSWLRTKGYVIFLEYWTVFLFINIFSMNKCFLIKVSIALLILNCSNFWIDPIIIPPEHETKSTMKGKIESIFVEKDSIRFAPAGLHRYMASELSNSFSLSVKWSWTNCKERLCGYKTHSMLSFPCTGCFKPPNRFEPFYHTYILLDVDPK